MEIMKLTQINAELPYVLEDNEVWVPVKELADLLGYDKTNNMVRLLAEDVKEKYIRKATELFNASDYHHLSKFINRRAVIHILFTSSKTVEYREHVIDVMESVLDHGGYIDPSATQEQVIELVQKYVERTELNSAEVEFYALRDKKYADGMTKLYDACVEELEESGELCLDEHLDNIKKRIGIYDERLDSKYILNWVDGYPEETHNPDYDEDYANDIVGRFVPDRYESYAASLPSSQRYAKQAAARAVDEAASGMKCKPKKDYWSEIEPESDGVLDLSCKEFLEWADSEASSEEEDFGKFDF